MPIGTVGSPIDLTDDSVPDSEIDEVVDLVKEEVGQARC